MRYGLRVMSRYLSRETQPFGKWNGIPIYLTTIICAMLVVGLVCTAFLESAESPLLETFTFFLPAHDWTELIAVVTYPFMDRVSFFSVFGILFFYWLGVGIESHLGRGVLAKLLVLLLLVPVAVAAIGWWAFGVPTIMPRFCMFGLSGDLFQMSALLIGFATLYPNAEWIGWVPFKWVAFACFVCGTLMAVAKHDWLGLYALCASCLAAFLYIRHAVEQEYDDYVPLSVRLRGWFRRKPKIRVLPNPNRHTTYRDRDRDNDPVTADYEELSNEVDALLDKIAKTGIDSLSRSERARLEKASQELQKKDRR